MTQQAELLKKIDALPPKYFGEVIDFVGYLEKKARQDIPLSEDNNGKIRLTRKELDEMLQDCPHTLALSGILSGMDDVDLDEIRMERLAKHL